MKLDFTVRTQADMEEAVARFGIVPLFQNSIEGFSIEEHVAKEAWFDSGQDGVWEWKGPVIRATGCAYGKLFEKKAAFVSPRWYAELANWRRDGYDLDARWDEGLLPREDHYLYTLIEQNQPVISKGLKRLGGYGKEGRKGFDGAILRLQYMGYVVISDFVYLTDRQGRRYGWGVAEYSTPEHWLGEDFSRTVYRREPRESYQMLCDHLRGLLDVSEEQVRRFLK